ncbi:hypothetical protein CKCBHOJB_01081 [Thauera sp. GDN1]|uniref:DUF2189 domain-containing protein n=1 Tax=Thauera sp. GDN1 TaxID=2944810 RepID=UPI00247A8A7B|nr:DUF2189 domain-containing protein [Thauera sp. GDN1]WEN41528.1 hypothetical protein CKCBHOJB_01081 [Thauera sp. GDN1]
MDKPYDSLDHHFNLPHIRSVGTERPMQWLRMGWDDMRENLGASLSYGVILAAIGYAILSYAADKPYLFMAAISGFMLIGPLAAAGLYEISRRHEKGERVSFMGSLRGLARNADSLAFFGAFLAIALVGWERISAIMFALFYRGEIGNVTNFVSGILGSGENLYFLAAYVIVGAVLAIVVFALSAISIPLLMDRDTDGVTAAMTSLRAVQTNFDTMMLWAVMIVLLVGIGFASMMVGMVILLPLVGHATWHAYRDLVR